MTKRIADLAGFFRRGLIMEQYKDPALSAELRCLAGPEHRSPLPEYEPITDIRQLDSDQIIYLARLARIVDERDGVPLFRKLRAARNRGVTLLVDAMDDQPYISSQLGPMLHLQEECASGAALAQKAVGAKGIRILVYKTINDLELKIPKTIRGLRVQRVGGVYPAESWEELARLRQQGSTPFYVGACALIHLHRAAYQGLAHTTAFVTVAGDCVDRPANLEVPIGMTATQALEACGLMAQPNRVIAGGSMTGVSLRDTDRETIVPTTRGLLAFGQDERNHGYVCIGCGRCTEVCPSGLDPRFICACLDRDRPDQLAKTDYAHCIGCMSCSYSCPAKLDLAARITRLSRRPEEVGL